MTVKIESHPGTQQLVTVRASEWPNFIHLTHSELADLYIALTDYYADNGDN